MDIGLPNEQTSRLGGNVSRLNNRMPHVRARRRQALLGCTLPQLIALIFFNLLQ